MCVCVCVCLCVCVCVCVCVWLHQVLVVACRILLPNQGGILGPWHWEHTVPATQPPGKSWTSCSGRKEGTGRTDTSVPSLLSRPVIFCRDASLSPLLSEPLENLCISSPPLSAALRAHARRYPWGPALCGRGGRQAWSISLGSRSASLGQARLPWGAP